MAHVVAGVVYYFTPYSSHGHLGRAYNNCCKIVPNDDDWIGLIDCDVMFFSDFGKQVEDVISNYNFDLLTCYATRIGEGCQQYNGKISTERDLVTLRQMVQQCSQGHWGKATAVSSSISGHFLLFQKKLWLEIPFPEYAEQGTILGIDRSWTKKVLNAGKGIGRMDGLCAIHYYRLDTDPSDISHLSGANLRPLML